MGLLRSKDEKTLGYSYERFDAMVSEMQAQVMDESVAQQRLDPARTHNACMQSACLRALKDKRMTVQPRP